MDGRLEEVFLGVVGKHLSAVEVYRHGASNQHEFNGVARVVGLLGPERREHAPCRYALLGDEDPYEWHDSWITFYDAREAHPTRSEHRLFYPAGCPVMQRAQPGDPCWIIRGLDETIHVVVAEAGSDVAGRLDVLFDTRLSALPERGFRQGLVDDGTATDLDAHELELLGFLGVPLEPQVPDIIDAAVVAFPPALGLPSSGDLASFVRGHLDLDLRDDVDGVFLAWNVATDEVFFALEHELVQAELNERFANRAIIDVQEFFEVAKRRTNARFSRAGTTFEKHLEAVFDGAGLRYSPQSRKLADGSKPDFLLPGRREYDDDQLVSLVTFLGAKTTARERWRQLLGEASRVSECYFATRDKALTDSTLGSMVTNDVHPVMAGPLIEQIYGGDQRILSIADFIEVVGDRQARVDRLLAARP